MFSKKILRITLIGLLVQFVYMNIGAIPERMMRPLLIIGLIVGCALLYAYGKGMLTEQKIIENVVAKTSDPLNQIHKHTLQEQEMIANYEARKKKAMPQEKISGDAVPM